MPLPIALPLTAGDPSANRPAGDAFHYELAEPAPYAPLFLGPFGPPSLVFLRDGRDLGPDFIDQVAQRFHERRMGGGVVRAHVEGGTLDGVQDSDSLSDGDASQLGAQDDAVDPVVAHQVFERGETGEQGFGFHGVDHPLTDGDAQ